VLEHRSIYQNEANKERPHFDGVAVDAGSIVAPSSETGRYGPEKSGAAGACEGGQFWSIPAFAGRGWKESAALGAVERGVWTAVSPFAEQKVTRGKNGDGLGSPTPTWRLPLRP
jgi:hypothetical protein